MRTSDSRSSREREREVLSHVRSRTLERNTIAGDLGVHERTVKLRAQYHDEARAPSVAEFITWHTEAASFPKGR